MTYGVYCKETARARTMVMHMGHEQAFCRAVKFSRKWELMARSAGSEQTYRVFAITPDMEDEYGQVLYRIPARM